MKKIFIFLHFWYSLLAYSQILNAPYQIEDDHKKIMHRYLTIFPTTLDPGEVYDSNNHFLINQVYEQLYGYENNQIYPLLAKSFPKITFLDVHKQPVKSTNIKNIAYVVYTIPLRNNIIYQPHPALHQVRQVVADDFVYAFKRTAFKHVNSPVVSLFSQYLLGYDEFLKNPLPSAQIEGVAALDPHTLQIITKGHYAQFIYWLAMSLLAPIPPEVDDYNQAIGDKDSWRWTTIGTGAYMIFQDKDYQTIHMQKNPNFRDFYLKNGEQNIKLPILDEILFHLEKESIPRWNKFLQGYYDYSSIPSETYEKIVWTGPGGETELSPQLVQKDIQLNLIPVYDITGIAFNMDDQTLGTNLFLRRAITIAFNYLEFINIFQNSYIQESQGPLPPLLIKSLHLNGFNPYIFDKHGQNIVRKSIHEATELLKKAGYPNGINPKTGKPLVLVMDVESTGKPSERAVFNWYRKQMNLLGIHLQVRENDKNRYQRLLANGQYQMTPFAWAADYPDAENFFMLFYGPNGKKYHSGQNLSNYQNPRFDELFQEYTHTLHPLEKQKLAQAMYQILIHDAVWAWASHSELLFLNYRWVNLLKNNSSYFTGISKYFDLNSQMRFESWNLNNQARWGSLFLILIFLILVFLPFFREWRNMNKHPVNRTSF